MIATCKHCNKPTDKRPKKDGNICFTCKKQSIAIRALRKAREKAFSKALKKVVKKVAKKKVVKKRKVKKIVKPPFKGIKIPERIPLNTYYKDGKLWLSVKGGEDILYITKKV